MKIMKFLALFLSIMALSIFLIINVDESFGLFAPSEKYVIQGTGFSISDSLLEESKFLLYFSTEQSGSRILMEPSDVSVLFNGKEFVFSNFEGSILREGRFLRLVGIADDSQGNEITLRLFGRLMGGNEDQTIYELKGKLEQDDVTNGIHFVAKSSFDMNSEIKETPSEPIVETKDSMEKSTPSIDLLPLISYTERVSQTKFFKFEIKVFESKQNPTSNFYQKGGEVSDVIINATVIDPTGTIIHSFEGATNENGYYSDGLTIPWHYRIGSYVFNVTGSYGENVGTVESPFYVLKRSD